MDKSGEGQRPRELQLPAGPPWDALARYVEQIGVSCRAVPDTGLDEAFEFVREIGGPPRVEGLLDASGVTPEQVGRVYQAAAASIAGPPGSAWVSNPPSR